MIVISNEKHCSAEGTLEQTVRLQTSPVCCDMLCLNAPVAHTHLWSHTHRGHELRADPIEVAVSLLYTEAWKERIWPLLKADFTRWTWNGDERRLFESIEDIWRLWIMTKTTKSWSSQPDLYILTLHILVLVWMQLYIVPSGNLLHSYWKWPFIDIYSGFSHS